MRRKAISVIGCVLTLFLLGGCGGGGGGGSSSPYTGLTTPAVIDNTNAVEIALGAYYGGEMTDTSFLPGVLDVNGRNRANPPPLHVVALVRTLMDVTESIGGKSQSSASMGHARPSTVWSDSGRIPDGAVDNYVDYSFSWNDQTGTFSGTFSFRNYGDGEGGVLNGSIQVSGTTSIYYDPDPQPGDILEITLRISSFTLADGIDTVTISGSITLVNDVPTGGGSATVNLYVTDGSTGKTGKIENYAVNITRGVDGVGPYAEVTLSGRIYFHDYGFVDVATNVPFRTYDANLFPSSGVLVVTGSGGRSARFVVVDESTGYYVDADLNADGIYEWSSTPYPWV